ncbi:hypothetical protein GEMRC1_002083 [Eukaryota sp. GEM-RC1]
MSYRYLHKPCSTVIPSIFSLLCRFHLHCSTLSPFPPQFLSVLSSLEDKRPTVGFSKYKITKPLRGLWLSGSPGINILNVSSDDSNGSMICLDTVQRISQVCPIHPSSFHDRSPSVSSMAASLHSPNVQSPLGFTESKSKQSMSAGQRVRQLLGGGIEINIETPRSEIFTPMNDLRSPVAYTPSSAKSVIRSKLVEDSESKFGNQGHSARSNPFYSSNSNTGKVDSAKSIIQPESRSKVESRESFADQKEIKTLKNHLRLTKSELKEVHGQRIVLESQLADVSRSHEQLEKEVVELKDKLSAKNNIIRRLEKEKEKLGFENSQLSSKSNLESDFTSNVIENVKNERDEAVFKYDSLEQEFESTSSHNQSLQSTVDNLSQELENETNIRISLEDQIFELQESLKIELSSKNELINSESLVRGGYPQENNQARG